MTSATALHADTPLQRAPGLGRPERSSIWIEAFILFEIACQVALLSTSFGAFRPLFRIAAFGASLLFLFFMPTGGKLHPAAKPVGIVLAIVGIGFFHPLTNNAIAGAAEIALYVAIVGPIFWVRSLRVNASGFRRILLLLWSFHVLSSMLGVLQTYYPGRFQPSLSTAIARMGPSYVNDLKIQTASGERTFRPMGLSDVPGGAAASGFYTALLGLGFLLTEKQMVWKVLFSLGILAGMVCLYLSQVRMYMVMTGICMAVLYGMLSLRREKTKVMVITIALPLLVALSLAFAVRIGGPSVTNRLKSFVRERPETVYYQSRGHYLRTTFTWLLPRYPLGAGLGRWGMVYAYFGSDRDPRKDLIWAELQCTGWILDGGAPLLLAYVLALLVACWTTLKIALIRKGDLWIWGVIILAYNCGAVSATFSSPFFISQGGMEFWLLNAALFAAAVQTSPIVSTKVHPIWGPKVNAPRMWA